MFSGVKRGERIGGERGGGGAISTFYTAAAAVVAAAKKCSEQGYIRRRRPRYFRRCFVQKNKISTTSNLELYVHIWTKLKKNRRKIGFALFLRQGEKKGWKPLFFFLPTPTEKEEEEEEDEE